MDVLILGGSGFVGRHIADALQRDGHAVTLFNRGMSDPSDARPMERVRGDRETDLPRLGNRKWDAVVDTSAYVPRTVEASARYFANRTRRYVFVSTISVYDMSVAPLNEESPTLRMPAGADRAKMVPEAYGALKALCEHVVENAFRARCTILRPSLVAGPHDPTDRFTYWAVRVARGGDVLAPEGPQTRTRFIDVRDLADFCTRVVARQISGTFGVVNEGIAFGTLLETCRQIARSDARFVWADAAFLERNAVRPWIDLPLWIPASANMPGAFSLDTRRARAAGLLVRPLEQTVRDTLAWARRRPVTHAWKAGLPPGRERELLTDLAKSGLTAKVK